MNRSSKLITAAVVAITTGGLIAAGNSLAADSKQSMEKCYGIAKAGKNDCQTAASACAGTSTTDRQKDAYITLAKGTCNKISGGSLTPG